MPELLRYRYQAGETCAFVQELHILVEMPDQPQVVDSARVEGTLKVVELHPDHSFSLQMSSRVTRQVRLIGPFPDDAGNYRISRRGELITAQPVAPSVPFLVFPLEPVEVKRAWKSIEPILARPVAMSHTMGLIEEYEGERVAHLVSEGSAVGEPAIEFLGVRLFSIERGRPLVQKTMTRYTFSEMGTTTLVVEEHSSD